MSRQDTIDFITAFAVGTVVGIGATLLLQPERTPKERVLRQLKPFKKKMRRSYGLAKESLREGSDATGEMTTELVSAGRELLGEFRGEVARILSDAQDEMQEMVEQKVEGLSHGLHKTRRKIGL